MIPMQVLAPVSPPTDWFGVGVVVIIGLVMVAIGAYVVWIKRTPGAQLGEAELERIADFIHRKQTEPAVAVPLTYDGRTFPDQASLDEYKAAQAVIEKYKGGTP